MEASADLAGAVFLAVVPLRPQHPRQVVPVYPAFLVGDLLRLRLRHQLQRPRQHQLRDLVAEALVLAQLPYLVWSGMGLLLALLPVLAAWVPKALVPALAAAGWRELLA